MKARLRPRGRRDDVRWAWARYALGRLLQVTGLVLGLVAATAFFGTPSTLAMLRMLLVGVAFFLPGWWLARKDPRP